MSKVMFAYAMVGTEDFPSCTSEGKAYTSQHACDMYGDAISDEQADPIEALDGLNSMEKIAQAKIWRSTVKAALTRCQDAVLVAELCGDREQRRIACSEIVEAIMEHVDYNIDYALDVLYRKCDIYKCPPDHVAIKHGIDNKDNIDMMQSVNNLIDDIFNESMKIAKKVVD